MDNNKEGIKPNASGIAFGENYIDVIAGIGVGQVRVITDFTDNNKEGIVECKCAKCKTKKRVSQL